MNNISKSALADLDELFDFTNELFDLYQAMKDLDYDGKRYTNDFYKIVNRVKELREITTTIESRIASNYDELKKVICFLDEKLGLSYDPNEIDSIMCYNGPREQMVPMRIVNNLNKSYANIVEVEDIFINDGVDYDDEMLEKASKIAKYRRYYGSLISTNIDFMVLAKIKSECLLDEGALKEDFYCIKYDMAFLNKEIESDLVENNYEINENPFIIRSGINNLLGVSSEYNEVYKSELFDSIIGGHLELLQKSDADIAQKRFAGAEAITYAYCILSALILMDNEKEAQKILEKLTILSENLDKYRTFIVVKNLLSIIVNDYESTKNNYQFISIGGR